VLIRIDRAGVAARLGATPIEVTPEGFKKYRGVAAFGDTVYEYPEKGRNEYVPAAEALAPDIIATLVGKPFTIHHPEDLLTADAPDDVKEHVEGTVSAVRANLEKSPPELEVEVVVWTRPAQEEIESGAVVELSPGYFCEEDDAPANAVGPGGKPYTKIQRGRKYNHLSGVMRARGVTPDGRRARLDGDGWKPVDLHLPSHATYTTGPLAGRGVDQFCIVTGAAVHVDAAPPDPTDHVPLADWPGPFIAAAAYPHADALENDMYPNLADADPSLPPPSDAMPLAAAPDMDPAQALAAFSPEAAEILKSLPPADLAALMQMAVGREAEAAEHAVEAEAAAAGIPMVEPDAAPAKVEIEVEPASEGEEETEGAEGGSPLPAEGEADATAPMPPGGAGPASPATMGDLAAAIDALGNKMIDMFKAVMGEASKAAPKTDAASSPALKSKPAAAARTENADAARLDAERTAGEAALVAAVKKAGHRVDSYPEAAAKAVAIVKDHATPGVHALAEKAAASTLKADRDLLLALFDDAETRRRDALVGEQFNSLRLVLDAEDDYRKRTDAVGASPTANADAPLPAFLPIPGAARAGK
jgi:hypothetical protein